MVPASAIADVHLRSLACRVTGSEGQFAGQVLGEGSGRLEWGSGGVIPPVEALIAAARPGGATACSLALPPDLHNPLVNQRVRCQLEVRPDQKVRFAGAAQAGKDLFVPPMSTQVSADQTHPCHSDPRSGCHFFCGGEPSDQTYPFYSNPRSG